MDKKMMLDEIIRHYADGNKAKFSRQLGVAAQTISAWFFRNTFDAELIYAKCSGLSSSWLLTGEGPMLAADGAQGLVVNDQIPVAHPATEPGEGIPLIPIEAMAGALTSDVTVMDYECERYIVPAFRGADFLITVKGDSMTPTFRSGDMVACQRIPMQDLFFQWGKPYVIDTTQGPIIKRINPGHDAEHISINSDNDRYGTFELPVTSIRAVAIVIGIIRLE